MVQKGCVELHCAHTVPRPGKITLFRSFPFQFIVNSKSPIVFSHPFFTTSFYIHPVMKLWSIDSYFMIHLFRIAIEPLRRICLAGSWRGIHVRGFFSVLNCFALSDQKWTKSALYFLRYSQFWPFFVDFLLNYIFPG